MTDLEYLTGLSPLLTPPMLTDTSDAQKRVTRMQVLLYLGRERLKS